MSYKRYYIYHQNMPYDEDIYHEFKGHRNIVAGEVPPTSARFGSRGPISKTLNAFLNTGMGGTVYCGVTDCGEIKGLNFSPYQMDHMRVSVQDAMSHFQPAVPAHRWKLEFVPILAEKPDAEQLAKISQSSERYDARQRERSHVIGTHQYCWCDKDAIAAFNNGIVYCDYVAEIVIHQWKASNPLDAHMVSTKTKISPIHETDDGKVYMRKNASVSMLTLQEVIELTKSQVRMFYSKAKCDL